MATFIVSRVLVQTISVEAETGESAIEQAAFMFDSDWNTVEEGEYKAEEKTPS